MSDALPRVIVRGGGDLATGVVWRLHQCRFPVLVLELPHPLVIRRTVSFASAVFEEECIVEGVPARRVETPVLAHQRQVPVLVDPVGDAIEVLRPDVVIDARMTKTPNDTRIDQAPLVVGLGPGFVVGRHCHRIIETQRGHFLGRVIRDGSALPDSGRPGRLGGHDVQRVLRAPRDGVFETQAHLGAPVAAGDPVGTVGGEAVTTTIAGTLRGLLRPGTPVRRGMKVGDVDPRREDEFDMHTISDKSRAIGGGALEAVLAWWTARD